MTTIHAPFPTEVECKIGAVPRQDRLLKSWPELQIRITQLAREGSPRPVALASGEVITQLQLDSSRTDSAVRVSHAVSLRLIASVRTDFSASDRERAWWLPVRLGADGRTGDAARCRRAPLTS